MTISWKFHITGPNLNKKVEKSIRIQIYKNEDFREYSPLIIFMKRKRVFQEYCYLPHFLRSVSVRFDAEIPCAAFNFYSRKKF